MSTPEPYPYRQLNYPVNNLGQSFTQEQKLQTRANIGIPSSANNTDKVLTVDNAAGELAWKEVEILEVPVQDVEVDGQSVVNASGVAEITMPSIPVTDVTVNGTSVVSNTVAEVTVPTAVSDLQNDVGYITSADVPSAQTQSDWEESDSSDPSFIQNKPTPKQLVAGSNISISESQTTVTISAAEQVNADWDANSGVSQILNKPNLATVATTGDYADLSNKPTIPDAQVQSNWNESDSTSKAYIQNKPDLSVYAQSANLATVATSGDYADLSNKPTIPAAQIQADWNETNTSSKAYIQNKPTIPAAVTVDQTYDASSTNPQSGTAIAQAIASIPSSTYTAGDAIDITNDEISVDYDTNTLDVVGQTVVENVTQKSASGLFLLPSSVVALLSRQDNTQVTVHIPANVLKNEDFYIEDVTDVTFRLTLYATDSSSESSVSLYSTPVEYTIDNDNALFTNQDLVFSLPASVANQWSQNLSSAVAFNICGQKYSAPATSSVLTVVGDLSTDPITFTFADASATKLAVKNPLPASTSADADKVLKVDANGVPEWGTGGKTYTGTDGVVVDNVNDTVGLETPVDIVAGPGIVIDNPDGNTLRVSVDQAIETVLWTGDTQPIRTVSSTINLSETVMNFELIRFEGLNSYAGISDALKFANTVPANSEMCFGNNLTISNGTVIVEAAYATVSGSSLTLIGAGRGQSNSSGQMSFRTDHGPTLYKVIGIHRIANN